MSYLCCVRNHLKTQWNKTNSYFIAHHSVLGIQIGLRGDCLPLLHIAPSGLAQLVLEETRRLYSHASGALVLAVG